MINSTNITTEQYEKVMAGINMTDSKLGLSVCSLSKELDNVSIY